MSITLKEVSIVEKSILRNLYSLYLHDLSKFTTLIDIGEDGFFEFEGLEKFWEVEGLSPYFIKSDNTIVGFVLLLERPFLKKENDIGINDLFILNKYKGRGIGKQAVEKIFEMKQGQYFVIELINNKAAVQFWKKIYTEYDIQFEESQEYIDGEACLLQTFKKIHNKFL